MDIETDLDKGMRQMSVRGHIRFSIKADDTEENQKVHDAFRAFAKLETDNNFTQALRKLLENLERDWKFEMVWNKLEELETKVAALGKPKSEEKEVRDNGTF